jgi:hypothetical protein
MDHASEGEGTINALKLMVPGVSYAKENIVNFSIGMGNWMSDCCEEFCVCADKEIAQNVAATVSRRTFVPARSIPCATSAGTISHQRSRGWLRRRMTEAVANLP